VAPHDHFWEMWLRSATPKIPRPMIRRRVLKVLELVEIGNLSEWKTRKPAA